MTTLVVIIFYLCLLLGLGFLSSRLFRGTSKDYFVASHSIGPFLLLMSVFGTTMTAFALVGSTGKSFERGIGTYGLMASISGLVHAGIFFLVGIRLWAFGKKHGYITQIQFFRSRFDSDRLGYLLFPILVLLVVPYLLIGIIGAGKTIEPVTAGAFTEIFTNPSAPQWLGGIPPWLTGLVVSLVVLTYVFMGGSRGAAYANTFQTIVFMVMGLVAFVYIINGLGGLEQAGKVPARINDAGVLVQDYKFDRKAGELQKNEPPKPIGKVLNSKNSNLTNKQPHLSRTPVLIEFKKKHPKTGEISFFERELGIPFITFVSYFFIPLSVGMFPHLFQHWLTAKSAKAFRLTVIAHPLCIMVVWVPCVLVGAWASGVLPPGIPPPAVLSAMLKLLVGDPILTGLLTAGVLAAIMSSLDSQFLCLGTMFTNDIVVHRAGTKKYTDKQVIMIARLFIVLIVALTYVLAMWAKDANVFDLAIWCFSGFSALFPVVFAALYWKRATKHGAVASIISALLSWLYFFHLSGYGGEMVIGPGIIPAAVCFMVATIALIGVSLLTKPPSEETLKKFFPRG
ncbi:MAG: sodium:solute symporter family protein [Opitutae bacterium]|jgi:solute:Na+ symporter, SSS family|nr:sodium:solute symporter family protein [Opitutae bacterium]MBT5715891.1 sodium:solute symporter family protein [Opitutae bacterium]